MGDRKVQDRNKVFFGIPNVDANYEINYARDEAYKDTSDKVVTAPTTTVTAAPAAPTAGGGSLNFTAPATGFPVNGLAISGTPIQHLSVAASQIRVIAMYDANNSLGLGNNVFIGGNYYTTNSVGYNLSIIAYNGDTGAVTNLGFGGTIPNNSTQWSGKIIGSTMYFKQLNSASTVIYAWRLATGWTTINVTNSSNISTAVINGSEKILYNTGSGTRRWFYIDPVTLTEQVGGTLPTGATRILGHGGWMWTDNGYVATAASPTTWTQIVPSMSLTTDFDRCRVAVLDSGDLLRIARFTTGSPAVTAYGLEVYSRTNGSVSQKTNLFTATGAMLDGEPQSPSGTIFPFIVPISSTIYVGGLIGAQVINPSSSSNAYVGAIWATDGVSSNRILQETYVDPVGTSHAVAVGLDETLNKTGVVLGLAVPSAGTSGLASTSYITATNG